jgi:hypothetical protein
MFGHHTGSGATSQSAFGRFDDNRPSVGSGSASDSNLAREAGINDVDHGAASDRQGVADVAADRQQDLDTAGDFSDDDGGFGGDDDSDFA